MENIPNHNYIMSRPDFADVIGVSPSMVIKWEKQGLKPDKVEYRNTSRRRYNINHVLEVRQKFKPLPKRPCKSLVFWLLKGGVGKTTISFNLSCALSRMGYKVLAIDLDGQSHLTTCFGIPNADEEKLNTLFDILYEDQKDPKEVILNLSPTLDLIPASLDTAALDFFLVLEKTREGKFNRLKDLINSFKSQYDFIIMDAAPNFNLLNINALFASDEIIAPMLTDFLSHHSVSLLYETIAQMAHSFKETSFEIPQIRLLANHFDVRNKLCQESLGRLRMGESKDHVLNTVIHLSAALAESTKQMRPVFTFDSRSTGAADIMALAKEIIGEKITQEPVDEK
jgi:chromosome partitioning protein